MWKQLTQKARKAILVAHEEAVRLGYSSVCSEHLLLALIREEECTAAMILARMGLDLGTVRVQIMKQLSPGKESLDGMQLAPDAKHAIDFAFAEVTHMQDDWVGTEHLLVGLVHDAGGKASHVLNSLGINVQKVREELSNVKAGTLPFGTVAAELTAPSPAYV